METTKRKRGEVRDDGMVFWQYQKTCLNGERWVTPEKFAGMREKHAARERNRYANDPEHREKKGAYERNRYANDPEHREKLRAQQLEYHRNRYANDPEFREKKAAYGLEYMRNRYANDPLFAATLRIRTRTRKAFLRIATDKPASTEELLGTDWQALKTHIESQFVEGMGWENMSEWHIDHIIPLASATTEEELAALCHYTNLQPLFASDNLRKGAKLPQTELNHE